MPWFTLMLAACDPTVDELPHVRILSPADGDTPCLASEDGLTCDPVVCGDPLVVELEVRGITLVDPYHPPDPLPADAGHVDCTLNGQDAIMSDGPHLEISGWADGEYQLKVELSRADHTPLEPYAGDFLYIHLATTECDR